GPRAGGMFGIIRVHGYVEDRPALPGAHAESVCYACASIDAGRSTMSDSKQKGVLYVVATPIGNLEDISYRAVRLLREADLIACEDTRQTRKLLDHYGIQTPVTSYHEHNEAARAEELAARLASGQRIAQVSDAGMPGISDPGFRLIQLAIARGFTVVPVPGASAVIAAVAAGGLPTDAFEFHGFL